MPFKPHPTEPDKVVMCFGERTYTRPSEWVGLTEDDLQEIHRGILIKGMGSYKTEDIYRAIEAKLKEKNT